ncbi:MAG: hypothetical protein WDA08_02270 [Weeksellaceae bacterium]
MILKDTSILLRIEKDRKQKWQLLASRKRISLSEFITAAVENKMTADEKRQILGFIEKQDNIFIKIETNINQFAKMANTQKHIPIRSFEVFQTKLDEITRLKEIQNQMFHKIYTQLAKNQ